MSLQCFPIGKAVTGINTYLKEWQRPVDAFNPLINAYTYRGTVNKRTGAKVFGNQLDDGQPVMGIMRRIDESTGDQTLLVASTEHLYEYINFSNTFSKLIYVSGSTFWQGTATGTITMSTWWPNWSAGTVTITDGTTTITDNGIGGFSNGGIFAAGGTINYTTGSVTLNFTGSTPNVSLNVAGTIAGAYFTGDNTNFFNWTNWQPTDPVTFINSVSQFYCTNNVDPITLFDGTYLSRPVFYINNAKTDYIKTAINMQVYKNRLLFFRPTVNVASIDYALNQSVYFSKLFNPTNVINDVAGNGGQITAATGDILLAVEFLRDTIVIFFTNSTWILRFTGIDSAPYRIDKINNSKLNNAPYATTSYDERCTSMGGTGFTACDGVNVQRYDINIIDYYENNISEKYYAQSFSQRYDNLNQTWMMYVSNGNPNAIVGDGAPSSDSVLIYNFLEDSWATYKYDILMTCMGTYQVINGARWNTLVSPWVDEDLPWDSFIHQEAAITLLGGDTTGNVYLLDSDAITDDGKSFPISITSTRWNPIIQVGQKVQFPYIDIYYSIASTDPEDPIVLTITFFVDNSTTPALTMPLTMDGPANSSFTWKRVYINLIGQFIQMNISSVSDGTFEILGFNLWAKPSGRLTPR